MSILKWYMVIASYVAWFLLGSKKNEAAFVYFTPIPIGITLMLLGVID